jgi:hypothetical protein
MLYAGVQSEWQENQPADRVPMAYTGGREQHDPRGNDGLRVAI